MEMEESAEKGAETEDGDREGDMKREEREETIDR